MNKIKKSFILYILVICLGNTNAQTYNITGTVLNSESKIPVQNVNVFIKNSDIGTSTDIEGNFYLFLNNELESESELSIKMIGFNELTIPLDKSNIEICPECLSSSIDLGEIFITTKSLELESIYIHAHQHESKQISNISIHGQHLNENLSGNIASTLKNQPNVGISSLGVVTSKPVLRGLSGDRFVLTKDGNVMGDLSQSSIDHVITLEMTEVNEIEIIRGPKALVFGSNAIGGVINTRLNGDPKVKFDEIHTKLNFGGESFNKGVYGNLYLYLPIRNNQINFSINSRETQNQTSPKKELENTNSKTSNIKLGFTSYFQASYINFVIENYNMDYGIPPSEEGHINGVDISLVKNTLQLNYHRDISWFNFNQFDLKYNFINYSHDEYESASNFRSVGLSKNTYNTKIEFKSLQSILGSEINFKQFSAEGFYWTPSTDELDLSIYSFLEKDFHEYSLLGSFRLGYLYIHPKKPFMDFSNLEIDDVIDRQFMYLSSSIGIKRIVNNFEFGSWLMSTMRAPQIEELYSDGPHLGTYSYEIGTPGLDLEKNYGIETSVKYSTDAFNSSLTSFYNYSSYYYQMNKMGECDEVFVDGEDHPCAGVDYIEWGSGSTGWLYKYQTEGIKAIIKGLEFNIESNFNNIQLEYNFSLVRGDDITNKTPLSYINPDKEIFMFRYNVDIFKNTIRLSKMHRQNRLGEFETETPSSLIVDYIFSIRIKNQNLTIQAKNIFNKKSYNHLSRIKSIIPEPGRNISLNYKIFF